jgi:hypothetical protein
MCPCASLDVGSTRALAELRAPFRAFHSPSPTLPLPRRLVRTRTRTPPWPWPPLPAEQSSMATSIAWLCPAPFPLSTAGHTTASSSASPRPALSSLHPPPLPRPLPLPSRCRCSWTGHLRPPLAWQRPSAVAPSGEQAAAPLPCCHHRRSRLVAERRCRRPLALVAGPPRIAASCTKPLIGCAGVRACSSAAARRQHYSCRPNTGSPWASSALFQGRRREDSVYLFLLG